MPRKSLPDVWLALPVIVLVVLGIVMIYSASAFVAVREHKPQYHFLVRQLVWAAVGGAALAVVYRVDYRAYRRWALPAAGAVLLLLVAVLVPPFGHLKGGVRRWMGFGPLDFQPSELAKLGLMVFLSAVLAAKRERFLRDGAKAIIPELAIVGGALGLIMLEPDLGTTITLAASLGALLFVGGLRIRNLLIGGGVGAAAVAVSLYFNPYQWHRVQTFLDPWSAARGKGYQTVQAFLALGRGGVAGTGPAASRQKLFFLPAPHTDFILAVIGEELGFLGLVLVVALFGAILWRGMRIALRAPDLFGTYLAFGLTFCLFLQAVINIMVVAGLLPTKGLTLPFLSYGGTSLVASLVAVGVLLNISRHGVTPQVR
ncbi:MAG TPA: putative lipid II flippase FtsW [bacterium]